MNHRALSEGMDGGGGDTNVSCQLKFRLFVSCQLNFIACCFIFRLQERQKHYKSSDKVIFVLTTAMVKRKRKIRSRKNSTCVPDKHCISMTSNLDTNTRFKRGTSHVSYQIHLYSTLVRRRYGSCFRRST